ncbi:hypothetical protein JXR93_11930 [bacterium]|nr:hypothetical protein [bacterium]
MSDQKFELRTLVFIDQLQPQFAQYIAKENRVYDPQEFDSALFIEIAPAMEIHSMIDMALKSTSVRLGSVVTERQFGMMQIQHPNQGEVKEAGRAILEAAGLTENDRAKITILTNKVIRGVEQDHAIYFTGNSKGNMVLAGDSVLIIEATPAAYLSIATNEALKAADVQLNMAQVTGATGRLIMSGKETMIDYAAEAAITALNKLNDMLASGNSTQLS